MTIIDTLKNEGWNVKEDYLTELLKDQSLNYQSVVKQLMNTDIKEYGVSSLPSDLGKGKSCMVKIPLILQVTNVRNVSAPKANEESTTAPRMLRVTLTDGIGYVHGLEFSLIKCISLKTAPGTKLKLLSKVPVAGGHFMLNPSNTQLVGGTVEELFQKWKVSQSVSKYLRSFVASDGSGPPPWVPFGQKIPVEREKNFKALADPTAKKKDDDDFEHQRKKVVSELSKENSQKVFGGGKQMLDSNVQRIINYGGFTIEEAEWALRRNKDDVHRAIQDLKRARFGGDEAYQGRGSTAPEESERPRGGRRGRGGRGKGKDNKGPDGSDDDTPLSASARPSKPASLLDYLESRILDKTGETPEAPAFVEEKPDIRFGRGRRGRGRGDRKQQKTSSYQPEPSFSSENWPSLGQEPEVDTKASMQQVQNNSSSYSIGQYEYKNNYHGQQNYSQNQTGYREPDTRNYQSKYKDNQQNFRGNQSSGYKNTSNYRDNSSNYREKTSGYRDNSSNYRGSSNNYRGNSSNYRGNSSNYRDTSNYRDNASSYRENQSNYRENVSNGSNSQSSANYRDNTSYYQENAPNYRKNYTTYRDNPSNYRENYSSYQDRSNYYGQQNSSENYARDAQPQRSSYRNDAPKYDQMEDNSQRTRKPEQAFYKRGSGRETHPGNNVARGGYTRGGQHDYASRGPQQNYNQPEGTEPSYGVVETGGKNFNRGGTRVHTAKERELIAAFQMSMVMDGLYESPSYDPQNLATYPQGGNQNYAANSSNYQEFSGTYEYHRGGDGYARRSRGRPGYH